jgi:multimeric flavodoxin WrbA
MKAVILSAVPVGHASLTELAGVLRAELEHAGYETSATFELTTLKLAFCQGEFDCWVKTPGRCRAHDAESDIVAAVHDADALVFLGPLTFGGHGSVLKRAIDRLLCLLEPFFTQRAALTHHSSRYAHPPRLFAVAWTPKLIAAQAVTFAELTDANAINYVSPTTGAVVLDDAGRSAWASMLRRLFSSARVPGQGITGRAELREALLVAAAGDSVVGPLWASRAAILVGSPKAPGTSASELLARAVEARLVRAGVATELFHARAFVHDGDRAEAQARAMAEAELLVLVSPLYVDAFPSITTHALELIAAARAVAPRPGRLAVLVNCGFPEAEQTRTALRIARHFADEAGYAWAGGLPLGGGGVVTSGSDLEHANGPTAHVVEALDLAVPALAAGNVVPREAIEAMARAPMPDAFYRLMGDLGWRWQAHQNGVPQKELHARALDVLQSSGKLSE